MKRLFIIATIMLLQSTMCIMKSMASLVGEWTIYPALTTLTEAVDAGDKAYFLASNYLYSVNKQTESVVVYDKAHTLNDCDIRHIAWCQDARRLIILYANYNIDLLEENENTINISDYYSKSMTEDKSVNSIDVIGEYAYLSTGFGIIKLNMKKAEISDTYNLGFPVRWTHIENGRIYAESQTNGQFSASVTSNLQDKNNWQRTGDFVAPKTGISGELYSMAKKYKPAGSARNEHGGLVFMHNRLYSIPGWGSTSNVRVSSIQIKEGDNWTYLDNNISYLTTRRYTGLNAIAVDEKNPDHFYVGARSGVFEYNDGKAVTEWWFENCPMECVLSLGPTHKNYTIVPGLTYDKNGNLWCTNAEAEHAALYKLDTSGKWTSYQHKELFAAGQNFSMAKTQNLMFDSRGLLWFVNDAWNSPSLIRYEPQTDKIFVFDSAVNQDGSEFSFRKGRTVVEDKEGNIWFGTDVGLLLLPADNVMTEEHIFEQVKVPRNDGTNLADYLMNGVSITCMAVDGANRKWIGTEEQGIYVISSDNMQQLHHFTTTNSPLISNLIESIAIDNASGEVYIGTAIGLCSYTMDATTPAEEFNKDDVYAYPNPVTPDYTGPITITGLTYNASIRITTASGQLVAKGTSNGGTFVWDGKDIDGKRVASGVYMVLAATEDGKHGAVCKIAVVR